MSSRGTTPPEKVKQRHQRPESVLSLRDAPSALQHRKLQTLFYDKVQSCLNVFVCFILPVCVLPSGLLPCIILFKDGGLNWL